MTISINDNYNKSLIRFNQAGAHRFESLTFEAMQEKETVKQYFMREHLERYVEPWALKYVGPAMIGDVDAAFSLSLALSNEKRGAVTVAFWRVKAPVPAFAALLKAMWGHDRQLLIAAAKTRQRLKCMFRYAKFQIPEELPATLQVWRGTSGMLVNQAKKGLSWTTDRDMACWFAMRYANRFDRPLVLSTVVFKESIFHYDNSRGESEIVLFDAPNPVVDGTPDEWLERSDAIVAMRNAEHEEWLKKLSMNSASIQTARILAKAAA